MGTPDNKETMRVLLSLLAVVLIFGLFIPLLLYLAIGLWMVFYLWYALMLTGVGSYLVAFLLEDHDKPPSPPTRTIGRIT